MCRLTKQLANRRICGRQTFVWRQWNKIYFSHMGGKFFFSPIVVLVFIPFSSWACSRWLSPPRHLHLKNNNKKLWRRQTFQSSLAAWLQTHQYFACKNRDTQVEIWAELKFLWQTFLAQKQWEIAWKDVLTSYSSGEIIACPLDSGSIAHAPCCQTPFSSMSPSNDRPEGVWTIALTLAFSVWVGATDKCY